jgi:transcription factor SOX7/8/10/18 (SOX group E/F)
MLFRADFVRMKHVPGSVETTHGSLSKIIGNCWRQLPLEEKRVWEIKAKHAKAEHKARYPGYRFRPVHNKAKRAERAAAAAAKPPTSPEEDLRCEAVAALLLQGKKGQDLTDAVRALDDSHPPASAAVTPSTAPSFEWPQQQQHLAVPHSYASLRRPSSVPPLPTHGLGFPMMMNVPGANGGIAIPSLPFLHPFSRPDSPSSGAASARSVLGSRRTSSVPPQLGASRNMWFGAAVPTEPAFANEALPEMNTALFEPSFFDASFATPSASSGGFFANLFEGAQAPTDVSALSPLDPLAGAPGGQTHQAYGVSFDPSTFAFSHPPASTYSASPSPSESSLSSATHQNQQRQHVFAEPAPPTLAAPMPLRAPSFAAFEHEHFFFGAGAQQPLQQQQQMLPAEGMAMLMQGQDVVFDLGEAAAGMFTGAMQGQDGVVDHHAVKFAPEFYASQGQQAQFGFMSEY